MTLQEEPTKKLREWVTRFLEKDLIPNEAEIIQQVILGREIQDFPDCVDMSNVKGWYTIRQLGAKNRATFDLVRLHYKSAHEKKIKLRVETWTQLIIDRLTGK